MKPTLLLATLAMLACTVAHDAEADQVSGAYQVPKVAMRDSGLHAIFLTGPIPDEGCALSDRAILDPRLRMSETFLEAILDALHSGKRVSIRVDGCLPIDFGETLTAPRIFKVDINL